jgi:mannose-6-phosphate isomerase-like protein (cupin superfamily)
VVSGELQFEFGPNGAESVVAHAGDFFIVPPHTVHREGNPGSEEQVLVGVRVGTGPTVINVDGPEPA